jgi:hypothetical protein
LEPVVDEKRVVRISLGYLAILAGLLVTTVIFVTTLRTDVMVVLNRIERHEQMLEENQKSILELQYGLRDFREVYDRDMNRYFRDHPEVNR